MEPPRPRQSGPERHTAMGSFREKRVVFRLGVSSSSTDMIDKTDKLRSFLARVLCLHLLRSMTRCAMSIDPKSFLVLSQAERASCKMAPAVANYIEVTGGGSKWPSALDHYWRRRRRWKSLASSMVVKQDSSFQVSPFMKKLPIGYGNSNCSRLSID
ncbi:hypothetical protein Ae201684P_007506 [Aphanomyces euteiches]|nr:hypothetical protein Ae201684P_007506 [Aphanomyces euteiches]